MPDRVQPGIYFRPKQRPAPFYRLVLLNVDSAASRAEAQEGLTAVWEMLDGLRRGVVRDLPGVQVPAGALTCLLGVGARLFDETLHAPGLLATTKRAPELVRLQTGRAPFPVLPWVDDARRRTGEADLVVQLIARTELAVNRAVVELAKLIADERLPLELVAVHSGFGRDDRRSWIDFHDGVNNMDSRERRLAIEVGGVEVPWMQGGTYMAFLRIAVDLAVWRALPREHQEVLVGRDKLTGCPLERVTRRRGRLVPVPIAGCPVTEASPPEAAAAFRDPPRPGDPLLQASHVHRANHNRGTPDNPDDNRIFRQGYEFFDVAADGTLTVGLNFVSFQCDLGRVTEMLGLREWLGDVNFGGRVRPAPGDPPAAEFLAVVAGGFYAVPPRASPFPGAMLFAL